MEKVLIRTGYENPCDYIGSYMKRVVAGTDTWSNHAYGIAIDLDYGGDTDGDGDPTIDSNPHLHRPIVDSDFGNTIQLTKENVDAILAIKNLDGDPMWRWLGYFNGDAMHFDAAVAPQFTQVDWSTTEAGGNDVIAWIDWIKGWVEGMDENHVRKLHSAGIISGDVDYWIRLLDRPDDPAWRYFYPRAQATTWAKIGEL
jgi:hypothetical protein